MKKLLLIFIFLSLLFSCKNNKYDYEKNLNHFKNLIKEINNFFVDPSEDSLKISNYFTEDFIFYSYPAGNKKGVKTSKNKYINELKEMKKMNVSINIGHSIYLPGIDEESYNLDGSVRVYYGATLSVDTNNVDFSGYQTVNFRNGKISGIWEWADYGGVSNVLMK